MQDQFNAPVMPDEDDELLVCGMVVDGDDEDGSQNIGGGKENATWASEAMGLGGSSTEGRRGATQPLWAESG